MNSSNKGKKKPSTNRLQKDLFNHWQLPDVAQEKDKQETIITDAFGHNANAKLQQDDRPVFAPTLSQIEQLRHAAEQEGFTQGQAQGYQQGFEEGKNTGFEQGKAEGFAQGNKDGMAQGLNESQALIEQLETIIASLQMPLANLEKQVESELLQLVETIVKVISCQGCYPLKDDILAIIQQGMAALPVINEPVLIKLHPHDLAKIETIYTEKELRQKQWQLEAEAKVDEGGCLLSTKHTQVDLTLSHRIETALANLIERRQGLQQSMVTEQQGGEAISEQVIIEDKAQIEPESENGNVKQEPTEQQIKQVKADD